MGFYLTFGFFGFKVVNKRKMKLFEGNGDFESSNFILLGCQPALSESISS